MAEVAGHSTGIIASPDGRVESERHSSPSQTSSSSLPTSNKRKRASSLLQNKDLIPSQMVSPDPTTSHVIPPQSPTTTAPALPNEPLPPPLPDEPIPAPESELDDGWAPVWDSTAQAYYFYNRFTSASQWENPRVPEATNHDRIEAVAATAPGVAVGLHTSNVLAPPPGLIEPTAVAGGYNPAVHGDYDPNADYAQLSTDPTSSTILSAVLLRPDGTPLPIDGDAYAATAQFNRFTGRFQNTELKPENYNDEAKSKRQMAAFFDVDAAANTHDGRSLKKERQERKLTKEEVRAFREKKKERKEQKKRAWLKD